MGDRILVCDDDSSVRSLLSRTLVRSGFRVRTAETGERALEEIATHTPDLLLLDLDLPGIDGLDVLRQVRARHGCELLPVVLITGHTDAQSCERGLEAGADEFAPKPFELRQLLARVRSLLRVKHATDQLERTENVVLALARAVEARDAYTDRHIRRIAEYSRALALALGASNEEADYAWYGGMLHDVGKIAIDPLLLRKPGPLTPEEFEEVKRHPEMGAAIIGSLRFAPIVAPIVRSHHERWDGSGYPHGLVGEDIPLAARVVAVVDAYDAMTTDRPYREALEPTEAVRRLRQGGGRQWDHTVVDVFVDLLQNGELPDLSDRSPAPTGSGGRGSKRVA